jgi:oligoendopeptidase F
VKLRLSIFAAVVSLAAAPVYRIDFARYFFPEPSAEKADRSRLEELLQSLQAYRENGAQSAGQLLTMLRLFERAEIEFQKHETYLFLRRSIDTTDEASARDDDRLTALFSEKTAFVKRELGKIGPERLSGFLLAEPGLKPYVFAIESARREAAHALSLSEEELLASLAPATTGWQADLYFKLRDRTDFGSVMGAAGKLDVLGDRNAIASDPNRAVREEGFRKRFAGFEGEKDLYAFVLTRLVRARNALARAHGFPDAPSEVYYSRYLDRSQVAQTLSALLRAGDLNRRYERLRADRVRAISGHSDVQVWDLSLRPAGFAQPRFPFEKACRDVREALSPLGPDFGRQLDQLLDPRNGRMDIGPGSHRAPGGFSAGFPGVTSVFYSAAFEGYYKDVSVLGHEATHAVHRQLMGENPVLPIYAEGPNLPESFAVFSELLLAQHLARRETDPLRREFFLEQFLDVKGMDLFVSARDATLEEALYDGVESGAVKTAGDLDALVARVDEPYTLWAAKNPELRSLWMTNTLLYEDPLYLVNYVYAEILALKYLEMFTQDRERFVSGYTALLRNGFDAPTEDLLRRFLGIGFKDPELVSGAVRVLDEQIRELETLYQAPPPPGGPR